MGTLGGCDGRATAQEAQRSHPTSAVRGRSWEDPMPEGRRPRGVTPRLRSGAAAESTRLRWHRNGCEELPRIRGQGQRREELPRVRSQGQWLGGDTLGPKPEARGRGREELPHARGQGR